MSDAAKEDKAERLETDREPGALHPRLTLTLRGHDQAEAQLAAALASGRMHHAWLLTGPKGVGKATLAYRFARAALGAVPRGPRPFDVPDDDPIVRRISQQLHPDVFVLRRGLNDKGRPRREITADEARGLAAFLSLKSTEGGWRIAIVDAVDDLNRHAANAILKTLEEPPPRTILLLVCHAPGAILATIRSRCRRLALRPLPEDDVRAVLAASDVAGDEALAALHFAGGRPGRALALAGLRVGALDAAIRKALKAAPQKGGAAFLPLAFDRVGDQSDRLILALTLLRDFAHRAARCAAGAEQIAEADASVMAALAGPDRAGRWAEAYQSLLALEGETEGLDLDATHAFTRIGDIMAKAAAPC